MLIIKKESGVKASHFHITKQNIFAEKETHFHISNLKRQNLN